MAGTDNVMIAVNGCTLKKKLNTWWSKGLEQNRTVELVPAKPKKMLLFDSNGIGWSVFHSLPTLSYGEMETSIIYGFLNTLFHIQKEELADTIVFAWDATAPYCKRTELFPAYKGKRKAKRTEMTPKEKADFKSVIKQFEQLKHNILPGLGFSNVLYQDGYEGDDILASVVLSNPNVRIKMICRDGDLIQMITPKCVMQDWQKGTIMTESSIFDEYGIYPNKWAEMKSLAGCPTDEVPGIPSVGNNRAIDYITGKMKVNSKFYNTIKYNSEDIIAFTKKLVTLPFEGVPTFELYKDTCKINKLKRIAREFGLTSYRTPGRLADFVKCFC